MGNFELRHWLLRLRQPDGKGRQVDGEVELESPNEEETEVVKHLGEEVPVQKWQC